MTYPQNTELKTSVHRRVGYLLAALGLLSGLAGAAQAQARYSYSADGSEVTDSKTGLIWRRCSEGQSWSAGTCIGTATISTQENALYQAQGQTGWRLPNVKELSSLADKTRSNPAIDTTAFPATPSASYWSASPYAGDAAVKAWSVDFKDGYVRPYFRDGNGLSLYYLIRLVR